LKAAGYARVWMPNKSSTSCDLGIFVYQPTESVATSEVQVGRWEWSEWCCLMQGAVAMVAEVGNVLGQYALEVAAVDDQYPVEQLTADGADPSFGDCVCPRCSHRCTQDADASLMKTASKASVNLLSRSRIKNLNVAVRSPRSIRRFRAC
jgi:hypothetical protein